MRFLLDENVHRGLLVFLKEQGHEAALSPKGLSNGNVMALAVSEGRILVTHDEDFATHLVPRKPHAGILLIKIPSRHFERLKRSVDELLATWRSPDQFTGKLLVLFEDRCEEFP